MQVIAKTNSSWYEVTAPDGKHGYMSTTYLVLDHTEGSASEATSSVVESRQLRDQPFRIYRVVPELDKITVYARHVFYDLLDNMIKSYKPSSSAAGASVVQTISSSCLSEHDFTFYSGLDSQAEDVEFENCNPVDALLGESGVVEKYTGELTRDWWDVYVVKRVGQDSNVQIRQAKNLLGISYDIDLTDVVTRIMPMGEDADGNVLYIPFWQASGESEKTSIRVKTKHSQMVQEGQYLGGHVPYGYKLEHQGRTNKKNQQVRDLVVDEDEATIVKEIFDLLTNHGYGTNRVAQYLNEKGIKTKHGTSLWRGTSIRAIIDNPIYIGIYHMQGVQSEPFDHLKIIDEDLFMRCQQTVKGRSTKNFDGEPVVFRTDTRSLLTGVIYCGHCGCRLCYNHHHEERKLANGGTGIYDYETYRCYRKISSSRTCDGQSVYKATVLNEAVENQVRLFLSKLEAVPKERLVELASARNEETYKVAYKQAQKDFESTQKQVTALEEEAVKALTGESQLDLTIVNQMLLKHRAKLEASQKAMEEAQARMQEERENAKATKAQVDELLSWAECFDKADIGTKHLIVSRLIERVEVRTGYKLHIKFKISLKQFLGQK